MKHVWLALGLTLACAGARKPLPSPESNPPQPVFYEIFVRSFLDSNGDGIGDLDGITQKLSYLKQLGVGGLWLTPIHPSPSYHGYDVTNYDAVHPQLGTLESYTQFLNQAHALGMRVILDLVINHTSDQHPWFAAHPDWYLWRAQDPGWRQPWPGGGPSWHLGGHRGYYFGVFAASMPDLNFRHPAVTQEMTRVVSTWLDRGVDGFRVDAARHLMEDPQGHQADLAETHAWFQQLRAGTSGAHPNALWVAEAWTTRNNVLPYVAPGEFTHALDFDLATAVDAAFATQQAGGLLGELKAISHWETQATFLSNHDLNRLVDRLPSESAVKAAHVVLLTLPGMPLMYYGDEVLMHGGPQAGDPGKRTPMAWTAAGGFSAGQPWEEPAASGNVEDAQANAHSLLNLIIALNKLRPTLGEFRLLTSGHPAVVAYARGAVEVRINTAARTVKLRGPAHAHVLLGDNPQALPAHGFSVFHI